MRLSGPAWSALLILVLLAVVAALPGLVWPTGSVEQDLGARLRPPAWVGAGSWVHPFGTDHLGRDVLSRIVYGARVSVSVGLAAVLIGCTLGTTAGLTAGYLGGRADSVIMTLADVQLAIPFVLLAIAIVAVLGPDLINLIAVIGIGAWANYARVTRSITLTLRQQEFVQAARSLGASDVRILLRHVLPNLRSTVVILATLELGRAILTESTLSFLGLGVQPPQPSWGSMIFGGTGYLSTAWWIAFFPGVALLVACLAINELGDWLNDRDTALRRG